MAKEKFDRSKPHVNIGTVSQILEDTSGQLTFGGFGSTTEGNPAPSTTLTFSAPASSNPESATVGYPFDTDFFIDPAISGDVLSIDFQLDVLPTIVDGASQIDVTLAILQDEPFIAAASGQSTSSGASWITLGDTGLQATDFSAVGGGTARPDFSRSFQFGYAFRGDYSTTALSVELGLDNMQVEITTVPEPTTIVLMISLAASLLWSRLWIGKNSD